MQHQLNLPVQVTNGLCYLTNHVRRQCQLMTSVSAPPHHHHHCSYNLVISKPATAHHNLSVSSFFFLISYRLVPLFPFGILLVTELNFCVGVAAYFRKVSWNVRVEIFQVRDLFVFVLMYINDTARACSSHLMYKPSKVIPGTVF